MLSAILRSGDDKETDQYIPLEVIDNRALLSLPENEPLICFTDQTSSELWASFSDNDFARSSSPSYNENDPLLPDEQQSSTPMPQPQHDTLRRRANNRLKILKENNKFYLEYDFDDNGKPIIKAIRDGTPNAPIPRSLICKVDKNKSLNDDNNSVTTMDFTDPAFPTNSPIFFQSAKTKVPDQVSNWQVCVKFENMSDEEISLGEITYLRDACTLPVTKCGCIDHFFIVHMHTVFHDRMFRLVPKRPEVDWNRWISCSWDSCLVKKYGIHKYDVSDGWDTEIGNLTFGEENRVEVNLEGVHNTTENNSCKAILLAVSVAVFDLHLAPRRCCGFRAPIGKTGQSSCMLFAFFVICLVIIVIVLRFL